MSYTPWVERRKDARLSKGLPFHYELRDQQKYGDGLTRDISEGGLSMISEEYIPQASQMSVRINLAPDHPIEVGGEVRWAWRMPHSYHYEVGLAFTDVSSAARRELSEYVSMNR